MVPLEGPVGVGALVDAIMFGCLIVQSCVYYKNSRGDPWWLKVLVSLFLFLLLSHLSCATTWLWASVKVTTEGALNVPDYASIVFGISGMFGATILFLERSFFSHRILKASNNHMLAFLFFLFCTFAFTAALGAASVFFTYPTAQLTSQLASSWIFPLSIFVGLACDLAITIATGFYFISQTPTEETDAIGRLGHLSLLVAETSAITSIFDVSVVAVYWLTRSNFSWVGQLVATPGVFANTLLIALHARGHMCPDIQHQRTLKIGDQVIDSQAKRPPITIAISKQIERRSEKFPV